MREASYILLLRCALLLYILRPIWGNRSRETSREDSLLRLFFFSKVVQVTLYYSFVPISQSPCSDAVLRIQDLKSPRLCRVLVVCFSVVDLGIVVVNVTMYICALLSFFAREERFFFAV